MTESQRITQALKRLLKKKGLTYRRIAQSMSVSEPTVKRMFSRESFTLDRVLQLTSLLGITLSDLALEAEQSGPSIRTLTEAQEKELVSDRQLLLVAICVLNGWRAGEIVETYRISMPECVRKLVRLDKLGLITLQPGNRVRLNIARDFDWIRQGPIQRFFRNEEKADFLSSDFDGDGETFAFLYGELTAAAKGRLIAMLKKMREEFSELHRESAGAPFAQRTSVCLLLAQRHWEPRGFSALRRG
jgi:transcriptional regulator with XRE-family HTH domain